MPGRAQEARPGLPFTGWSPVTRHPLPLPDQCHVRCHFIAFAGEEQGLIGATAHAKAAAASLALAPAAPVVKSARGPTLGRGTTGYDATLRWQASPGAVGYRIVWRDSWTNDWQQSRPVGNLTSATVPGLSIDDYVFGVAAIGPDGHESLVSASLIPPRR